MAAASSSSVHPPAITIPPRYTFIAGVIPVLDVVIGTIVNFDLNGIAAIVDQKDDRAQLVADRRNLLRAQLEGTIADRGDDSTRFRTKGKPEGRAD